MNSARRLIVYLESPQISAYNIVGKSASFIGDAALGRVGCGKEASGTVVRAQAVLYLALELLVHYTRIEHE